MAIQQFRDRWGQRVWLEANDVFPNKRGNLIRLRDETGLKLDFFSTKERPCVELADSPYRKTPYAINIHPDNLVWECETCGLDTLPHKGQCPKCKELEGAK